MILGRTFISWMVASAALVSVLNLGCGRPSPEDDPEAITINNRGVALMGRFDYSAAREEFQKVVELYPKSADLKVNLAVATLNRQKEGDEQLALEILGQALTEEPQHARALYCTGLLQLHMGEPETALETFRRVVELDPDDADAAYFVGQCLMQMSRYEEALGSYERALELDPYLRSAYYTAFQTLQRLRRIDEAREMLQRFQSLDDNPQVRLVELKYTKMGQKASALAIGSPEVVGGARIDRPKGAVFAAAESILSVSGPETAESVGPEPHITAADYLGDGRVDLFIAGARCGAGCYNAVLQADEQGGYRQVEDHPLAAVPLVNAVLWGDVDNDGFVDAYLCRRGPNQLWLQGGDGLWENVSEATGTGGGDLDTIDGALFDADHDGDLDIFLANRDGDNELLNNNRDGTFRALAEERGLTGDGAAARGVVTGDLDHDGDADLIVINESAPHLVYLNELMWQYRLDESWQQVSSQSHLAMVAADRNADGRLELYSLGPDGALLEWSSSDPSREPTRLETITLDPAPSPPRLSVADLDGDGALEILGSGPSGWVVAPGSPAMPELLAGAGPGAVQAWSLVSDEPGQGPSLVGLAEGGALTRLAPGAGRYQFLAMTFSGKEDSSALMRTNASGIGTEVALRVGSRWTATSTFRASSGPGQSLQPMAIGLRGAARADFVALDWSDGVYQTELDLEPGSIHQIAEVQRQLSSCPVLFAWNGERFAFVSDLLGVGGMGYALGPPGEYAQPRPRESFLLPDGAVAARDGRVVLKLTEPMEEITYLDAVRVTAWDLPPGWAMTLDERMGINGPEPTGRPIFYREHRLPSAVVDARGADVTAAVREADLAAAPVGALDHRFIGRLAGEHVLTLSFDRPISSGPGRPVLVADGWVEYPYSQTNFAAWQASAAYLAPTLEAMGLDGRWRTVLEQLGYPAGMPRQMSLVLPDLPAGASRLRLSTNQEIYWDRLAIAYEEPCPEAVAHDLPLIMARLERTGFARRIDHPQRRPDYDYGHRSPVWDVRFMEGDYTRFGPVDELVGKADGALAIFGPGEEIHLELEAPRDEPRDGWARYWVLEVDGWCKDMDLYTRDGQTVAPLPSRGEASAERDRLHRQLNTRYLWGRD